MPAVILERGSELRRKAGRRRGGGRAEAGWRQGGGGRRRVPEDTDAQIALVGGSGGEGRALSGHRQPDRQPQVD